MATLKNIASQIIVILTLFVFLLSTTGFASFKHHCTHHETVSTILPDSDNCCSNEMIVSNAAQEDCCHTDLYCGIEESHSECCTDEMTYYRLSELFAPSVSEKQHLTCKIFIVKVNIQEDVIVDKPEKSMMEIAGTEIPVSGPPKYILYHQAKFAPPLI